MGFKQVSNMVLDKPQESNKSKFREVQNIVLDNQSIDKKNNGFMENISSDFNRRTQELGGFINRQKHPIIEAPATLGVGVGESIGFLGDVVGEGISSAYKTIVPEEKQNEVKEAFRRIGETKIGQLGIQAFKGGTDAFNKFEKQYPDAGLAVKSMFNILGGSTALKRVKPLVKVPLKASKASARETIDIIKDVNSMIKAKTDLTDLSTTRDIVERGYTKSMGIKPSKIKTDKHIDKIIDNANLATRTIMENLDDIKILDKHNIEIKRPPQTLREFGQGITGAKEKMFKQYNDIATKAGDKLINVDLTALKTELTKIVNDLDGMPSDIRKAASKALDEYNTIDSLTPLGTQSRVKILNNKLGAQLEYKSAARAIIDDLIRNNLKEGLNKAVEQIDKIGKYAEFRKKYGALKSIEEDVAKRAARFASKSEAGFFDISDVYTHAHLAAGLLTNNPYAIAHGATGVLSKARLKFLNNPNRHVAKMFKDIKTKIDAAHYNPKSKLFNNTTKKVKKSDIDYDIPTYLRQGKELNKFSNNIESDVLKDLSFIRQTKNQKLMDAGYYETAGLSDGLSIKKKRQKIIDNVISGNKKKFSRYKPKQIKTTLRPGGIKQRIQTKQEIIRDREIAAIEKNIDLAFKKQEYKQKLKGSPLTKQKKQYHKPMRPKQIKTTLRPEDVKQIIKNKIDEKIAEKEYLQIKMLDNAFKKQQYRQSLKGSPLIKPKNQMTKSIRPLTVKELLSK